jgi:hypothetical protein
MRHGKRHRVPVGRRDHVRACRRRGHSVVAPTKLPVGSGRAARRLEGTRLAPAQGMPMRNSIAFLLISLLAPACSSTSDTGANAPADASGDSGTCTGLPPSICQGCCGSTYAADECVNGTWVCRPLGIACTQCDSGVTDAAASDGSGDSATCTGTPPVICNGCCGSKYAADQCSNGTWACQPRGVACIQCDAAISDSPAGDASGDASTDGSGDSSTDAATCTGTRPNCFGNDTSRCCGNDPSGPATCSAGAWTCGTAPAPGCNGTSCLQEAGPG